MEFYLETSSSVSAGHTIDIKSKMVGTHVNKEEITFQLFLKICSKLISHKSSYYFLINSFKSAEVFDHGGCQIMINLLENWKQKLLDIHCSHKTEKKNHYYYADKLNSDKLY